MQQMQVRDSPRISHLEYPWRRGCLPSLRQGYVSLLLCLLMQFPQGALSGHQQHLPLQQQPLGSQPSPQQPLMTFGQNMPMQVSCYTHIRARQVSFALLPATCSESTPVI